MAEGWTRNLKGDIIEPYSAGIETHGLNSNAVKVMAESGIDISNYRSKHVDELMYPSFDYIVTLCSHANEYCPVFPGKAKIVHFGFEDPQKLAQESKSDEEKLEHFRRVRDDIKAFITKLPDELNK